MKSVIFQSDYSDSVLRLVQTDEGDIVVKISGSGEMRVATQGGQLHGDDLVEVVNAFKKIIDVLEKQSK